MLFTWILKLALNGRQLFQRRGGRAGIAIVVPWMTLATLADKDGMGAAMIARDALLEDVRLAGQALVLDVDRDSEVAADGERAYLSHGVVLSPVTVVSIEDGEPQALELWWMGDLPPGTSVDWTLRTGRTETPDQSAWTPWIRVPARPGEAMRVVPVVGPFVQWRAVLSTRRRSESPTISRIRVRVIAAEEMRGEWQ